MDDSKLFLDQVGYKQHLDYISEAEQKLQEIQKFKGEVAIYQGDGWHDNPTFNQTQLEERMVLERLNKLKNDLSRIQIIEPTSDFSHNKANVGNLITIKMNYNNTHIERTFKLIASVPINNNEVSINSPLGNAILGKHINDIIQYTVASNVLTAQIINIE